MTAFTVGWLCFNSTLNVNRLNRAYSMLNFVSTICLNKKLKIL